MPKLKTPCSSGCATKDHKTYGECLKSKSVSHPPTILSAAQKSWDGELRAYERAVSQGIQPDGTSMKKIDAAVRMSDQMGKPYNAEKPYG